MRKTLIAAVMAVCCTPVIAIASEGATDTWEGDRHERRDHFGKRDGVQLTPEQRHTISKIQFDYHQGKDAVIDKYVEKLPAAEKAAMEKEFADIEDKREKEMRAVLTPEQVKQIEAAEAERAERKKEWEEFKKWREDNKKG